MNKKGRLIVIEGIDGSGKGTQADLLSKRLKEEGRKVLSENFPRYYSSVWGKMVGEFLVGKYGRGDIIDPHFTVLPYMLDQYVWVRDIGRPWLEKGGIIILDRYFTSNVHQVSRFKGRTKGDFRKWLWPIGYDGLGIVKPDLVLFLNVSPDFTSRLIKTKKVRSYLLGRKRDWAEKNQEHQWTAYKEYLYMTKHENNWSAIKCISGKKIDSPQVIHHRIWDKVIEMLKT